MRIERAVPRIGDVACRCRRRRSRRSPACRAGRSRAGTGAPSSQPPPGFQLADRVEHVRLIERRRHHLAVGVALLVRAAVRVRQPAVRVLADLALDQRSRSRYEWFWPSLRKLTLRERAVGVLGDGGGEHREVAAADVVDLAVDRPQPVGLPLVADAGVDAVLDAEVRVAEPPVEALGLRRLAELADVGLERQVGLTAGSARPAADRPSCGRRRRAGSRRSAGSGTSLSRERDVDAEVDVAAQADQLRAAEQLGRRDVDALRVDQRGRRPAAAPGSW